MSDWFLGNVEANGIRIHYSRTGGDKPPLVLCHGITDNGLCWTRVARVLEDDYDVIMPDARGHGESDAPETGYTVEELAADLAGLIEGLGLDKPYLMGHSMGAGTSAVTAAEYPGLVGCAILEDPPWWDQSTAGDTLEAQGKATADRALARMAMTYDELMVDQRKRHPTWVDVELEPWAESKAQLSPKILEYTSRLRHDWRPEVAKIACPVLLITGEPELESIVTSELAAEAARLNPRLRVAHIEGAGHSVHRDRFERFMDVVGAFLTKVQWSSG